MSMSKCVPAHMYLVCTGTSVGDSCGCELPSPLFCSAGHRVLCLSSLFRLKGSTSLCSLEMYHRDYDPPPRTSGWGEP